MMLIVGRESRPASLRSRETLRQVSSLLFISGSPTSVKKKVDKTRLGELDSSTLVDLIKDYARQETVDPLKGAGRWVGFGLLGSVLVMIGGIALTLALLRALQEETGSALTGNLSWAPYALTLLALSVVIGLLALRINKKTL